MKRYGWLVTVLIVVAFFIIHHRAVPNAPAPTGAVTTSSGLQISVVTKVPKGTGEVWILGRKSNGQYVVNVYNRQSLLHVFLAGQETAKDSSGTNYNASGAIRLGYTEYEATQIHVNPDGRSGYILFKAVSDGAGGNTPGTNHTNSASAS